MAEPEDATISIGTIVTYYLGMVGVPEGIFKEFETGTPLSNYFLTLEYGVEAGAPGEEEYTKISDIDLTQVINTPIYELNINPVVPDGEG